MNYIVFGAGINAKYIIINIKKMFPESNIYLIDNFHYDFDYEVFEETYPVYHTAKLLEEDFKDICIIISSIKNHNQMAEQLRNMGMIEGKHFFGGIRFIQSHWIDKDRGGLHPAMRLRVKLMSELISNECDSVLDVGCGEIFLKHCMHENIKYIPCDYIPHDDSTIVCDLNQKQYPQIQVHTVFLSGILEHVEDCSSFLDQMCRCARKEVILSYNTVEYRPNYEERCRSGILNYLSSYDIIEEFRHRHMYLRESKFFNCPPQLIFKFVKI